LNQLSSIADKPQTNDPEFSMKQNKDKGKGKEVAQGV